MRCFVKESYFILKVLLLGVFRYNSKGRELMTKDLKKDGTDETLVKMLRKGPTVQLNFSEKANLS